MTLKLGPLVRSLRRLVVDPMDFPATMVFIDATMDAALPWLRQRMLAGLDGPATRRLQALTDRPLELAALARLPANTLGHALAAFMRRYRLRQDAQAAAFPPLAAGLEREWILRRFGRVHDIHHVLLGLGTDAPAELALQFFNLRNFREPYAVFAVLAAPAVLLRYGEVRRTLRAIGGAWRLAGRAVNLFQVPFEELLAEDLGALRGALGLSTQQAHENWTQHSP